jgi:hypothetical protein
MIPADRAAQVRAQAERLFGRSPFREFFDRLEELIRVALVEKRDRRSRRVRGGPIMARVFILKLKTEDEGAIRRLRNALKTLWRRDKLRCVSAVEEKQTAAGTVLPANPETDKENA